MTQIDILLSIISDQQIILNALAAHVGARPNIHEILRITRKRIDNFRENGHARPSGVECSGPDAPGGEL